MRYTWDARKRRSNLRKHGLDFRDAHVVFEGVTLTIPDDRFEYGEERYVSVGLVNGVVVVIAHTEGPEAIRVISMRKATKNEEINYFAQVGDELEAGQGDEEQ